MKRRKRQEAPEGGWNVRQNVANILLNSLEILFSKDMEIFLFISLSIDFIRSVDSIASR